MPHPDLAATPTGRHRVAVVMLLLATVCWGLSFPTIKTLVLLQGRLVPGASGWFAAFSTLAPRYILGAVALAIWQARDLVTISRAEFRQGLAIGIFAGVGMIWQTDGLQYTAASTSAFLTQFYAILIPIYVAWKRRRNPGWAVWVSCALVAAGVSILGDFNWREFRFGRGEAETLLSSLFFMGQIIWLEKAEFAGNRPGKISLVSFAVQAVLLGVGLLLSAPTASALAVSWTSPAWVALTFQLTIFSTLLAYGLMNAWQPRISATEAGLIYCAEPLFSSAFAWFLPAYFSRWSGVSYSNESATMALLLGGGLITAANILVQLYPPPRAEPVRSATA